MEENKLQNCIGLDKIDFNEQEILQNWERIMPSNVAEVYIPLSCIENTADRMRFLSEHIISGKKAVVVCSKDHQKDILHAEADVMDILVLDCIARKIAFFEGETTAILVRDYIYGESIQGKVTRNGCFDEESARELGKSLLELVSKLYERNLSIDTSSLKAGNIIITQEDSMKFVEPEGINYCADLSKNWAATECAIGNILKFMISGGSGIPAGKISAEFAKVLERSTGATSENYRDVKEFMAALDATSPKLVKRKKMAKIMIALAATLILVMLIVPFGIRIGKNIANARRETELRNTPTELSGTPTCTPTPEEEEGQPL